MIGRTNAGGSGGESARLLVTAPEGSTVVASKGSKTIPLVYKEVEIPNPEYVLPEGYTQLEYIESTGTQQISFNIPNGVLATDGYEFEFNLTTTASGLIFGSLEESSYFDINAIHANFNNGIEFALGKNSNPNTIHNNIATSINTWYKVKLDKNSAYVNDVLVGTSSRGNCPNSNMWLFGRYNRDFIHGKIKKFTYTRTETALYIFVPCISPSNEVGMYDLVTSTFYGNSGTGSFTAGPEIPKTISAYYYTANLSEYGTYTVTATKDSQEVSDTVEVTEARDVFLTLNTQTHNTTYLYYLGDECTDITGGWSSWAYNNSNYTMAKESSYLFTDKRSGSYNVLEWSPNNPIDLSDYITVQTFSEGFMKTSYSNALHEGLAIQQVHDSTRNEAHFHSYINGSWSKEIVVKKIPNITIVYPYYPMLRIWAWYYASDTNQTKHYMFSVSKQDDISSLSFYGLTIAEIISNATSLLSDHSAVSSMIYNCTGDFMWSALADSGFVTALNASPYYSQIAANEEWGKALILLQ